MSEYQRRYDELRDPEFWRKLNPDLNVSLKERPIEKVKLAFSDEVLESVRESLRSEGYFQLNEVLDSALMDRLARGVENIYRADLPTAFAIVYDQYWEIFHQLRGLFQALLGEDFKQVPNFWCWFIERSSSSKGWGHHRDRPAVRSVDESGMPSSLTIWIPMTDADESNGCIYVLPSKFDPHFRGDLDNRSIDEYQNIRALPAKRGSVLSWSENLIHWGSRSSERAVNPRVSISFTFQRGDVNAYESPLIDCSNYPSLDHRLGLIGQNICSYADRSNASPAVLVAARRLSSLMPTIIIQNGRNLEILETDKRLSETRLWAMQEDYFASKKMLSWKSGEVPFYTTSRMSFVEGCVELFLSLLIDCQADLDFDAPFYILELGGGLGCFAQRFLSVLVERIAEFEFLERLKFVYVLSDFTQEMVEQHVDNPCLQEFFESGLLEIAAFKPETDRALKLLKSNTTIESATIKNPLFVVANYLFDTIRHDAFRVIPGSIQEARYTLFREGNPVIFENPAKIKEIKLSERFFDLGEPRYGEPAIDSILEFYRDNLDEASVIFPIGALRSIKNLIELSNNKLALLSNDKGFTSIHSRQILGLWAQEFACHGSFSFDVNFDAIARYFQNVGGLALTEAGDHNSLSTLFGTTIKNKLPLTEHFFKHNLQLGDAFNSSYNLEGFIGDFNIAQYPGSGLRVFMSIVQTYRYDPRMLLVAYEKTCEAIEGRG